VAGCDTGFGEVDGNRGAAGKRRRGSMRNGGVAAPGQRRTVGAAAPGFKPQAHPTKPRERGWIGRRRVW